VRGTIDDLSQHGMRFYGPLPPGIARDSAFAGRLTLPDGPLEFAGRVRNLIGLAEHPGVPKGFGGELSASAGDEQRIERFLFGSDMQWLVNGYSDQTETPLTHLLPALVPGPHRSAFRGVHWNAAEVTGADGRRCQALLSFASATSARHVWLLTFTPLPERQPLRLQCFRRREVAPQTVQLERADARHQLGPVAFVYRVAGIERNVIEHWSSDERQREVA